MELAKQYILQSISAAASNLRLNNQRIEIIAVLKEVISKSKDLQHDLNQMKKITSLSKFAIKLNEMYKYLNEGSVDFLKVTDRFKEHSYNLIKELNNFLDIVEPNSFKQTLHQLTEPESKIIEIVSETEDNDYSRTESNSAVPVTGSDESEKSKEPQDSNAEKTNSFNSFESKVLKPIKVLDSLLNRLEIDPEIPEELEEYSELMIENARLSLEHGFEILSQMHEILAAGFTHLKNRTIHPSREVIESLRSCLIVIVAVVKSKEVDIKNYLNRAEVFGSFIQNISTEETR